jgi:hypothetical protein
MPRGAGDPDNDVILTSQADFGWGAGDPVPGGWSGSLLDAVTWGAGDPEQEGNTVVFFASVNVLPDDGGEIAVLSAAWPRVGPYFVQLRDHFTNKLHPDASVQAYCYAPLDVLPTNAVRARQSPFECQTDISTTIVNGGRVNEPGALLRFILPPVPPSLYDVVLTWGDQLEYTVEVFQALRVVHRSRSRVQWSLRAALPPNYSKGAASPLVESQIAGWED